MILEAVYEPRLLESSHGFRPGRSQHTCLKYVRRTFRGVNWFIEGQRSWQCFDTIFNILKILEENIRDQRFIHLIKKGLQAKVILPGGEIESSCACASRKRRRLREGIGTPQGGVASPLLANIVLHKLDMFIQRLKRIVDRGKQRGTNPDYSKLMARSSYLLKKGRKAESRKLRKQARQVGFADPKDSKFLRIAYVRYADDFLVGISGPKILAERIRNLQNCAQRKRLSLFLLKK